MKKLIMPLMALVLLVAASSCEKCKDCTVTVKTEGMADVTNDLGELCGDALKDVDGETIDKEENGIKATWTYDCE